MASTAQSYRRRDRSAFQGVEDGVAAFLRVRAGRRAPTTEASAFSGRLALARPFVAEPTD